MLGYVAAPDRPEGYELRELSEPVPGPSDAVIEVRAFSLNRGEVTHMRTHTIPAGTTLGWDVAGVVVQAAADGSGPPVGAQAFGCSVVRGTWAERAAVSTSSLAVLPDGAGFEAGSTLGVAGLTAVYGLRYGGLLLGRTVIVTGAAGGVGRLAVQLAVRAGARVVAVVGTKERGAAVTELGLDGVELEIGTLAPEGTLGDLILESAGGESLTAAFTRVAPGGAIVTLGRSSMEPGKVPPDWFYRHATLHGLAYAHDMEADGSGPASLAMMGDLVARGLLDPGIGMQTGWKELGAAADALIQRRVSGKAVLLVE